MKLNEDFVPSTVNEAIDEIVNSLTPMEIEYIKTNNQSGIHFSVGMHLRNSWSLWDTDTPLNRDFRKKFQLFGHGDDVSGIIFEGVWAKVRGLNIEEILNETAEIFRKHWLKNGINPVTGLENIEL